MAVVTVLQLRNVVQTDPKAGVATVMTLDVMSVDIDARCAEDALEVYPNAVPLPVRWDSKVFAK